MDDVATKILFTMLDNYCDKAITYIDKELRLISRYDADRKYVINLYNDKRKKDMVLIRALDESEISLQSKINQVTDQWVKDESDSDASYSDTDESEAPDLESA
jgi:hypothetical protein